MIDLIRTRNQAGQEFYKTSQDLEAYKDKLLQSPDPSKWGINFAEVKMTPEEVSKNKLIAKSLMLPQQNQIMLEMKNIFGYFNHTMVKELTYMSNSRAKRYIRSLNNFCSAQAESLSVVRSGLTPARLVVFAADEAPVGHLLGAARSQGCVGWGCTISRQTSSPVY
jgi:hypothetical protein